MVDLFGGVLEAQLVEEVLYTPLGRFCLEYNPTLIKVKLSSLQLNPFAFNVTANNCYPKWTSLFPVYPEEHSYQKELIDFSQTSVHFPQNTRDN